jgi:hypothetical protein
MNSEAWFDLSLRHTGVLAIMLGRCDQHTHAQGNVRTCWRSKTQNKTLGIEYRIDGWEASFFTVGVDSQYLMHASAYRNLIPCDQL